eukprot:3311331-Lingulodinium_polyedra.AAC.1
MAFQWCLGPHFLHERSLASSTGGFAAATGASAEGSVPSLGAEDAAEEPGGAVALSALSLPGK